MEPSDQAPEQVALPSASIIIPTFNRRERLRRLLTGLAAEYRAGARFDAVVVDDGSTDGTDAMLAKLVTPFPVQALQQDNAGPAAARNRAIAAATGEVMIFLDDDVVPGAHLIERHLHAHMLHPRGVVFGPMLPPPGRALPPWLAWEAATLQKQYLAMQQGRYAPTPRQFFTANASVRKRDIDAARGFDEQLRRAEDVELGYRLHSIGLTFHFIANAYVVHTLSLIHI